jgi:hypothetical protein
MNLKITNSFLHRYGGILLLCGIFLFGGFKKCSESKSIPKEKTINYKIASTQL